MKLKSKIKYALAITPILVVAQLPLFIGIAKNEIKMGPGFEIKDICLADQSSKILLGKTKDRFFADANLDLAPGALPLFDEVAVTKKIKEVKAKNSEDYNRRIAQAKELLGKHYKKSVVRKGENVRGIQKFVKQQVKQLVTNEKWKSSHHKIASAILRESKRHGFDPIFLMAVIENESTFNPDIRGSFGEIGLMQVKPSTAEWISKKMKVHYKNAADLENPVKNIEIGSAYLAYLRTRFNAHSRLYISAYNMGTTNVNRALGKQIWPKDYASRVMNFYVKYYSELNGPTQLVSQN